MLTLPVNSFAWRVLNPIKLTVGKTRQLAQPNEAEIHQFGILDVAEIGRVCEHGVEFAYLS